VDHVRERQGFDLLPVAAFVAICAALFVVFGISVARLPIAPQPAAWRAFPHNPWLDGFLRWDAGWYRMIARQGYSFRTVRPQIVAFFPGYPALMRLVGPLTGGTDRAGIIITMTSGLGAATLFHRWCTQRLSRRAVRTALFVLLLSPFAYYLYGPVYADATFLFSTLGAFTLLDADRPILAGVAGAVATATRPLGIVVIAGLVFRAIERRGIRDLHLRDSGVLLACAGLGAYCILLWRRVGHPFAFISAQRAWGQTPGPSAWFKYQAVRAFRSPALDLAHVRIVVPAILFVIALWLVPAVWRRFGWAYGTYTAMTALLAGLGTADFIGVGRYLLGAFPLFAILGEKLAPRPRVALASLVVSGAAMGTFGSLFARWYYVS
jgi:hypothetical protein